MGVFDDARAVEEQQAAQQAASGEAGNSVYAGLPPAGFSPPQETYPVYHGTILPFTKDNTGHTYFDPLNAGPLGAARRAFTLPGRVMSGETKMPQSWDPADNDPAVAPMMGEVMNFSTMFGPGLNPMVRSGDRAIPGVKMAPKDMTLAKTPTSEELLDRGGQQIEAFKNMPIQYNPSYMGTLADKIEQRLVEEGVFPEDAKGLYASVRRLRDYIPRSDDPTASISVGPANLISIRKNIAKKFGVQGEDQHGVSVAHDEINNFLENPPAEAILARPATAARNPAIGDNGGPPLDPVAEAQHGAQLYKEGRGNYSAGMRDAELEAIQREARLRSRSANSGQNLDNTIRSKVTNAILNAKRLKGFTPEEEAMLQDVPEGSVPRNVARVTGNLLGGGGGLGAATSAALGTAAGHFAGLGDLSWLVGPTVPAVGAAIKRWGGKGTAEALSEVQQATRQRSPLFEQSLSGQDLVPNPGLMGDPRDQMARTLMRMYSTEGVPPAADEAPAKPPRVIIDTTDLP